MNLPEIQSSIASLIAGQTEIPEEALTPDAQLAEMGLDSLEALRLLVLLEKEFNVRLDDGDLPQFRCIRSLSELIASRTPQEIQAQ